MEKANLEAEDARIWGLLFLPVLITACGLFLFQLGTKPFWDYDEAIYANVVHDTVQSDDILTLHRDSEAFFEKPPLIFWTSIGADNIFHHPEFSYRLTAALAGIASVALVMLITYEICGNLSVAALAGLILLTTGPFLEAGRELRLDIPAISMILFSVYSFIRGMRSPKWLLGVGVGLGLGFMFKSVIGLLSLLLISSWSLFNWDFSWLKKPDLWIGGMLFVLIVLPWQVYEGAHYGQDFWRSSLLGILRHYNNDTLGGSISSVGYIKFFLTYAAPWTTIFIFVLIWLATKYKKFLSDHLRDIFIFGSTAAALFLFFLLSSTKILDYLLPVYPFVAITLALSIGYVVNEFRDHQKTIRVGFAGLLVIVIFALWVSINFGFHIFPYVAVNDLIVSEEKAAADIIVQQPETFDLYSYQYSYYDTVEYYSGRRSIQGMQDDQALDKPFLLLVSKPYMDWHTFPDELVAHLEILYKGQTLILYMFSP